ncbi:MAG: SDR family oxidoreductase [Bacteroidales bacterium]|nr:SDR family oxidoreductase [Bacteroidales bacterium]
MNRTILITGATSGIGKECAFSFAGLNDRLIITGRRADRLEKIAEELREQFNVQVLPLIFDVKDRNKVEEVLESVPADWRSVDVLINNAGLSLGLNHLQEGQVDDWDIMIDTNIKGLLYVSRKVIPWMIEYGKGHIINIGSIAGKEVYPKGNVYCATKFAVDALTKAMRIDLLVKGIKVSQIAPGAVETEFSEVRFKGDKELAANVYKGFTPLTGHDIAEAATWIAGLPPHVNVNDLVIMPAAQASPAYFDKNL